MSTPTIPQTLKELHRLRRLLRNLKSEIDLGPRVLKAQQAALEAAKATHKAAHDHVGRLKLTLRDDEGTLKQLNAQLAKFEKQLNDTGSTKEYQGKESEIRQAKEKITTTEEAILAGMEELEAKTAALPTDDRTWADAQKEFEQYQADARERMGILTADQTQAQADLAATETLLPPAVKPNYDRLVKQHGADCLAGLTHRTCGQCKMQVIEHVRFEVQAGKFMTCSTCGRGLYMKE